LSFPTLSDLREVSFTAGKAASCICTCLCVTFDPYNFKEAEWDAGQYVQGRAGYE